ncbi:MAG TPA: hypothetical protein VMA77_06920 [Solirubrobacteraceae bacterium]|nr:hypothetical protein [Solirubrobacteraceae bacterium]
MRPGDEPEGSRLPRRHSPRDARDPFLPAGPAATLGASLGPGHATLAATRVSRAGALLGAPAAGSSLFAVSRLFESWRVTAAGPSQRASILGLRLSYPAANLPGLAVVALAALGSP